MTDELIKAQIENLQIVISNQNKEISDLKEWIDRALRFHRAIQYSNSKKLRKVKWQLELIYSKLREIDFDKFRELATLLEKVQELLEEINVYV